MFTDTKHGADRLVRELLANGVQAAALHGGKSQPQRTRTLEQFRTGQVTALIATNVAARGIHIDGLDLVVNIDPPTDHKDYLHRGGRTARAGESGTVVTLVLPNQRREMTRMMAAAAITPHTTRSTPATRNWPGSPAPASPPASPSRSPTRSSNVPAQGASSRGRRSGTARPDAAPPLPGPRPAARPVVLRRRSRLRSEPHPRSASSPMRSTLHVNPVRQHALRHPRFAFDLVKSEVVQAMKGIKPETVTGESVTIGRRIYPVKQVGE